MKYYPTSYLIITIIINIVIFILLVFSSFIDANTLYNYTTFQRVCYLVDYKSNPKLDRIAPEQMQWNLCTHVIFAFADCQANGTIHVDQSLADYIQQMVQQNRNNNNNTKLMISIGGQEFGFTKNEASIERYLYCNIKIKITQIRFAFITIVCLKYIYI